MKCEHVRDAFSDRLDGVSVGGWKGLWVRLHLAFCPRCKRFYRTLEATTDALHALKDAPPPQPSTDTSTVASASPPR